MCTVMYVSVIDVIEVTGIYLIFGLMWSRDGVAGLSSMVGG